MAETQGHPCLGLSPVGHQHLDDEIGEEDQEGAGCIVFEGGEGRESILEGQGSVWRQERPGLPVTLAVSTAGKEQVSQPPIQSQVVATALPGAGLLPPIPT